MPEDDISIIANNADKWYAPDYAAGAGKGAAIGAGFGGVGGLLAGLGLLAIPGSDRSWLPDGWQRPQRAP